MKGNAVLGLCFLFAVTWAQYTTEWTSSNLGQYGWGGAFGYDMDNDGLVEYYVRQSGQLTFYNGDYSMEWNISIPGYTYVTVLSPRDIDGDGICIPLNTDNDASGEIIITAYYYNTGNSTYYGHFRVYDASTRVMEFQSNEITGFYGSASQEDIDGDGRDEIILTRFGSSTTSSYVDVYAYTGSSLSEDRTYSVIHKMRVVPNPSCVETSILFSVLQEEKNTPVSVTVYDAAGRRIRDLFSSSSSAPGTYELIWDGMDDQNCNVPSGTYVILVEIGNCRQNRTVQIVR